MNLVRYHYGNTKQFDTDCGYGGYMAYAWGSNIKGTRYTP